jgi:hypothetical protein
MRPASMFFSLLLASATLTAQTATGNRPAVMVAPVTAQACPVLLTVDRKATGAVIWTNSESDWFNAHSTLSLRELERALKAEPGFGKLSPQDQQSRLNQVAELYHMRHGQGLDVTFGKPQAQIVSADITVHGYPPMAHVIPATPSVPNEVTETFHLIASADKPLLHSSIWTQSMIMVNWVELTRLVYADGTTWQPSAPRECGAAPSLYVLVDSASR